MINDKKDIKDDFSAKKEGYYYYEKRVHKGGVLFAILLIFLGSIFLLNNFGVLPWSIWDTIAKFWPLFLILLGFQIIFGKSRTSNIIVGIIGLVFLAFIITYSISIVNPFFDQWLQSQLPWWSQIKEFIPQSEMSAEFEI